MAKKSVLIVLFDLPTTKKEHRKAYRDFRKFLLQHGYWQLQESVYVKLLRNPTAIKRESDSLKQNSPKEGSVQILPNSLENFKKLQSICGVPFSMEFFSDDIVCL